MRRTIDHVPEPQPELRIGDTERESALAALGEHMSAGRLDIDEYGERTAKVAASKTRGELLSLFDDLPAPYPTFGGIPAAAPPPGRPAEPIPAPPVRMSPSAMQRGYRALVPLAALVAVGLYLLVHLWYVFLIPAAVVLIGGAIWGEDHRRQRELAREEFRAQRRELRRRGRGRYW
jgi:Domain of unknown function (DUF1707)